MDLPAIEILCAVYDVNMLFQLALSRTLQTAFVTRRWMKSPYVGLEQCVGRKSVLVIVELATCSAFITSEPCTTMYSPFMFSKMVRSVESLCTRQSSLWVNILARERFLVQVDRCHMLL